MFDISKIEYSICGHTKSIRLAFNAYVNFQFRLTFCSYVDDCSIEVLAVFKRGQGASPKKKKSGNKKKKRL